jgi:enoyl-CoA hydratase/carnithine racemase
MELTGEPINAQRALTANMVSKVVPHDELMGTAEDMAGCILRNDRRAVESAKETIFEVIGRTLDEQLKVECLFGYALCGGNPEIGKRSAEFLAKVDRGRAGAPPMSHQTRGGGARADSTLICGDGEARC